MLLICGFVWNDKGGAIDGNHMCGLEVGHVDPHDCSTCHAHCLLDAGQVQRQRRTESGATQRVYDAIRTALGLLHDEALINGAKRVADTLAEARLTLTEMREALEAAKHALQHGRSSSHTCLGACCETAARVVDAALRADRLRLFLQEGADENAVRRG